MLKRPGAMPSAVVTVVCLVPLFAAASASGDTKTEAAAVSLFTKGRAVLPVTDAGNMTEYLEALAGRVGTEATQSYLTREGRQTLAPVPAGKAARPAFEWLAEAIDSKPVSFEVDSQGRWCFFLHGDLARLSSYAASGGVICKIDGFSRSAARDRIWTLTRLVFDRGLAKEVVATQMEMEVLEAVNSDGKRFPAKGPGGKNAPPMKASAHWVANQQTIWLEKADFPGDRIARLRVRGQVALRTGVTTFEIRTLGHDKPVTLTQSGVTVTLSPLQTPDGPGKGTWGLPVEVRTEYATPRGMSSHGESIVFLASDGKRLGRTSWSGRHGEGRHQMTIRIRAHTIDPSSTRMVMEYPTGLRILPFELTFQDVPIRDIQPRPNR